MTTLPKNTHRAVVSMKLPAQVTALVAYARSIVKGMTANPAFPNPVPPLATVTPAIDDLQAAQTVALTRVKGAASVRNEKRAALVQLLMQLKAYIQAQADAHVENGASTIESAGVAVRKTVSRKPRVFAATAGALSGTAMLVTASAGRRASYEWEYSTDAGKTWIALPPTMQAKTSVPGLQVGTSAQFRYRPVTKAGASDWSAPVTLIVH